MPIHKRVQVSAVYEEPRKMPGYQQFKTKYVVQGTKPRDCFSTWDVWQASLCKQAAAHGFPVTIATRETKWGQEIIHEPGGVTRVVEEGAA